MIKAIALVLAIALPSAAHASSQCGARDTITAGLQAKFKEQVRVIGMVPNGSVIEMWANEKTGTWTFVVTNPHGVSCVIGAGSAFEAVEIAKSDSSAL